MLSTNNSTSWFCTSEVFGHGEGRQCDAQADARWFVHLAEDQGGLFEHSGLFHLQTEVGTFAGALADSGEHRHTTVLGRHAVDHFGDENGLADSCTTEQTDLSTGEIRGEEVDDLDARFEHPLGRFESVERRSRTVDFPTLDIFEFLRVGVEDVAPHVPHVTERLRADGHRNATARVAHRGATLQTVGRLHADRTHAAVTELLGDLGKDDVRLAVNVDGELERRVQLGQRATRELDVDHRSGDCDDATILLVGGVICCHSHVSFSCSDSIAGYELAFDDNVVAIG